MRPRTRHVVEQAKQVTLCSRPRHYTGDSATRGGPAAPQHQDNHDPLDPFAEDEEFEAFPGVDGNPRPIHDLNAARVLILNASYEPLHVCSVKRAVALLMHDIAIRVEDSNRILRSPSQVFPVPSVIRLKKFVKRPPRHRVAFNRKNVFRRDDHRCQYCGTKSNDLTLDHVVPRSRGGSTSWENVVACCRRCNAKKRDRTPEEAHMTLERKPYAPRFMFSSAYGILPNIDPIWENYLPKSS